MYACKNGIIFVTINKSFQNIKVVNLTFSQKLGFRNNYTNTEGSIQAHMNLK